MSPDESFVAIDLDYPLPPDRSDLSARFHTFRGNGQVIATQVHYIVDDRRTRSFVVDGPPLHISFAPTTLEVLRHFVDEGSDVLFESADFLLLAVCLIAVARTSRTMSTAVTALLAGQVLVVVLSAGGLLVMSPSAMFVSGGARGFCRRRACDPRRDEPRIALAPGSVLRVWRHDRRWNRRAASARLGLHRHARRRRTAGICLHRVGRRDLGDCLLWSAAGLIRRRGRIAELAVLSTAIFAGHAALHRVLDQGQALADAGTFTLDRFLLTVTVGWALLILCAGILETVWSAGVDDQSRWLARPSKIETR